ncbi:EI24 domain-containing protein [Nocardioides sp. R-C-SC26]|uniref:EI24 domain-containing protein n=1 Tax=Nocardioides sp. R-C-SC26 TaxID=2870414 RepID=UPI001E5F19BF|nr:EI24 domain-containing protein [Nocardioides sp. R-C-SC26]
MPAVGASGVSGGARHLLDGWRFLRRRPGLLVLGIAPALVVFLVLATAWVLLALHVGDIVGWVTPFADDWADPLRGLARVLLAIALLLAAALLASAAFTGLSLLVGEPAYERIWRAVETELGGPVPAEDGVGFVETVRDAVVLTARGVATSALVVVSGVVPVVGPVLGIGAGVAINGRALARELLERPLQSRGYDRAATDRFLARHPREVTGFGVVAQVCFMVPLGAVLTMPAAVAGATMLARDLLDAESAQRR